MSNPALKNRTQFTSTLKNDLFTILDNYSEETGITKSRLFDNAMELYFKHIGLLPKKETKE